MSAELETLRAGYEAVWRHQDWSAMETLPEDFRSTSTFGLEFTADDREGFVRVFRDWFESFRDPVTTYDLEEVGPGLVLVDGITRGRGAASGIEIEMSYAQIWRFEERVPRSVEWFETREQALASLAPGESA